MNHFKPLLAGIIVVSLCCGVAAGQDSPVKAAAVANLASGEAAHAAAVDLASFPVITGKVTHALGNFNSFIPPQADDTLRFSLARDADSTKIDFERDDPRLRTAYVPLPGKLTVESVRYYGNGALMNVRLAARDSKPSVVVDIVPTPGAGKGPRYAVVWIMVESNVLHGVARIEGEFEGAFPRNTGTDLPVDD
jgi:hypothetical protein